MYDKEDICYLLIHVDDIAISSKNDKLIASVINHLQNIMDINNLGEIKTYLGLNITRSDEGIYYINQHAYITRTLVEFGMIDSKISSIPLSVDYGRISDDQLLTDNKNYQKLIGTLLFIAVNSRPDISAAVCILAQKTSSPNKTDWNELKRILKYLKGTSKLKLKLYDANYKEPLETWVDASWAEDKVDRKSNSGILVKLFGGVINWSCKKQTLVTLSSTEAEYVALAQAVQELQWIHRMLHDLKININLPLKFYEDNQSVLKMLTQEKPSNRTKHIDIKYHFIKDNYKNGTIEVNYCPTEEMIADFLTKPLTSIKIERICKELYKIEEEC
jgi:hypothetical protein